MLVSEAPKKSEVEGKPCLTINRAPAFLRQYTGEERQHRPAMLVSPVGSGADARVSAKSASYMELAGAEKDADCEEVKVSGGVSGKLGCCDLFKPESASVTQFRCGTCAYVR